MTNTRQKEYKLFSDYHNHPLGHDPNRRYDMETLSGWLEHAQKNQLTDIAFTDHDRYHPGVDFAAFDRFTEELALPAGVTFRMGIELDNDPETSKTGRAWTEKNYDKLDFILGSIHFIGDWAFDHPSFKAEFDNWDIDKLYEVYFLEIQRIAQDDIYDGLAHLDLIKIFGHRPTGDISALLHETISMIKASGKTIELSTAGWRKPVNELYPHDDILSLVREMNVPITIASDAHAPHDLGRDYDRLAIILSQYGFTEISTFEKHQRDTHSLLI